MQKIRLKIGALSLAFAKGVSSYFFFYTEHKKKCIKIKLSPIAANVILSNFSYVKGVPPMAMLFESTLKNYNINIVEANLVLVGNKKVPEFGIELLISSGRGEASNRMRTIASFHDGVAILKHFKSPLYIDRALFEKYAVSVEKDSIEALNYQLKLAEEAEDYERAQQIVDKINSLKNRLNERGSKDGDVKAK